VSSGAVYTVLPLCRLRYAGSASQWGFAIYLASKDGYQEAILPSGAFTGTPEEALDCACGLYLADPTAWRQPPTNSRTSPLRATEDRRDLVGTIAEI
jgi:hypothetical protein